MLFEIPPGVWQSLIVQLPVSIIFIAVGFTLYKRNRQNRIANTMIFFFLKVGIGLIAAVILRFYPDPTINAYGMRVGMYAIDVSIIDLLFFNLLIRSTDVITPRRQHIVTIIYWIIYLPLFSPLLPLEYVDRGGGLTEAVFSAEFSLYGGVLCEATFILVLYYSIRNLMTFRDKVLKLKFAQTTASILMFNWVLLGNFIFNWLDDPFWRQIFLITALIILPATYLLVKGMVLNPVKKTDAPSSE